MTQIFNRGGSLRYDMKGKKRKNHLANPVKRKIHIGTSQSTKVSVEEVKRKQKERAVSYTHLTLPTKVRV